jgi:hypothetical protein
MERREPETAFRRPFYDMQHACAFSFILLSFTRLPRFYGENMNYSLSIHLRYTAYARRPKRWITPKKPMFLAQNCG